MAIQPVPIKLAALLYGVIIVLTAALAVDPDELTIASVSWGGPIIGLAIMLTYTFKEIIHLEGDQQMRLTLHEYVHELRCAFPTLLFPMFATVVAVVGLSMDVSEDLLIDLIFYCGIVIVGGAAFWATFRNTRHVGSAIIRALIWIGICVLLLVLKKLA